MQHFTHFVSPRDARQGVQPSGTSPSLLRDALYCLVSCSLGGYAGWAIGLVLALPATAMVGLSLAMATLSCVFLLECPMARRGARYWKQFG